MTEKECNSQLWALLYLHDWDPPRPGQTHKWEPGKNIFPEIHAYYTTSQEAHAVRATMTAPDKYWVCRARPEDEARIQSALAASPQPARETEAEKLITEIEGCFPNWRSYRDIVDCINCTLADLRRDAR